MSSEELGCLGACDEAGLQLGDDVECCADCHDEAENGYGELMCMVMPSGMTAWVCCSVQGAVSAWVNDG